MLPIDKLAIIEDILFEINLMFDQTSPSSEVVETMLEIYGIDWIDEIHEAISIWESDMS